MTLSPSALALLIAFFVVAHPSPAAAAGSIHGRATTQAETETLGLGGVEVTVSPLEPGGKVFTVESIRDGRFLVRRLPPGWYRVSARLAGFTDRMREPVQLVDGQDLEVNLELDIAPLSEEVVVAGSATPVASETSQSIETMKGELIETLPVSGDDYRALLPILPGVVRAPDGRMSFKGGTEGQGALQVGQGYANDPSTGNFGVELPSDSIDSVEVTPNPYTAQDGRYSSTVVKIDTKAGDNQWRMLGNGVLPIPCLKVCDGHTWGIRAYRPRGWIGGPIVKNRVFISQGVQYRFGRVPIDSLPEDANETRDEGFETFTRLDANLNSKHAITATLALFPRRASFVGLSTFLPAESAPSFRMVGASATVLERAALSPVLFVESSATVSFYNVEVYGRGTADSPPTLTVEGVKNDYFNHQNRDTRSFQWTESITTAAHNVTGDHLLRAGTDVIGAGYRGDSENLPVLVQRKDGTVSERWGYRGPITQDVGAIDAAAFVQDRWRLNERLLVEPGLRVERDGLTRRTNLSPRGGLVVGVFGDDIGVVRGGAGVFYERTPLNVGAFESFQAATVSRFGADGATLLAPPVTLVHRTGSLQTPRSVIWNLEYDHRVGSNLLLKVNHLERHTSQIATLQPIATIGAGEMRLDSVGRARYSETELTARIGRTATRQLTISYVHSHALTSQNLYDTYFGTFRSPIVRPDEYSLSPLDVPHRLLVQAALPVSQKWTLSPLLEVRTGFPYSAVDQEQQFVGERNRGGRFPNFGTLDVSLLREATLLKHRVRIGMRVYNVFDNFTPRDVQNNVDSPAFGTFYNSIPVRLTALFAFLSQ